MTSPELDPHVTAAIENSFAKQGLMTTIGAELISLPQVKYDFASTPASHSPNTTDFFTPASSEQFSIHRAVGLHKR